MPGTRKNLCNKRLAGGGGVKIRFRSFHCSFSHTVGAHRAASIAAFAAILAASSSILAPTAFSLFQTAHADAVSASALSAQTIPELERTLPTFAEKAPTSQDGYGASSDAVSENGEYAGIVAAPIIEPTHFSYSPSILPVSARAASGDLEGDGVIGGYAEGDVAYISKTEMLEVVSGTAPFDDASGAGNDTSSSDDIVRSFDGASYDVEYTTTVRSDAPYDYYTSARIGLKAILHLPSDQATFDLSAMNWVDRTPGYEPNVSETIDADGNPIQILTAWRLIEATDEVPTVMPGEGTLSVAIDVLAMANGDKIPLDVSMMCEENEGGFESADARPVPDVPELTVSAAPKYNVQLKAVKQENIFGKGTYDFTKGTADAPDRDAGNAYGRIYAFGATLQLYNDSAKKQMRGIEIPTGPIDMEFELSTSFHPSDGPHKNEDIDTTDGYAPLLWTTADVKNTKDKYEGDFGRLTNENASTLQQAYAVYSAPASFYGADLGASSAPDKYFRSCYDSGKRITSKSGNTISVSISDYKIDISKMPSSAIGYQYGANNTYYTDGGEIRNIGCFASFNFWIVQPFYNQSTGEYCLDEFDTDHATFEPKIALSSFSAQGISGTSTATQSPTNDDTISDSQYIEIPGDLSAMGAFTVMSNEKGTLKGTDNTNWTGYFSGGNDTAMVGSNVRLQGGVRIHSYEIDTNPVGWRAVVKFDSDVIVPDLEAGKIGRNGYSGDETNSAVLYGAKKDKTGWASDEEQYSADVSELVYYDTYDELLADGAICVAVMFCSNYPQEDSPTVERNYQMSIPIKFIDDYSYAGHVASCSFSTMIWRRSAVEDLVVDYTGKAIGELKQSDYAAYMKDNAPYNIYDESNEKARTLLSLAQKWDYSDTFVKAEWDGNHMVSDQTGGWKHGDSCLLTAEETTVVKNVAQKDAAGERKSVFDLDNGQRYVDYEIDATVKRSQNASGIATEITITDTLPASLSYVPGSGTIGGSYSEGNGGREPGTVSDGDAIEPSGTVRNPDGSVTLTWTIPWSYVSDAIAATPGAGPSKSASLPTIRYSCLIGQAGDEDADVKNNQEIVSTASSNSTYDQREPDSVHANTDTASFVVSRLRQQSLTLFGAPLLNEVASPLTFRSAIGNYAKTPVADAYAVQLVPRADAADSGSGRPGASDFNGGYSVERINIDATKADLARLAFYYATDEKYLSADPMTIPLSEMKQWSTASIGADGTVSLPASAKGDAGADEQSPITAWCIVSSSLEPGERIVVDFDFLPYSNQGGDAYGAKWSDGGNTLSSTLYAVDRVVSGRVFIDADGDGGYEEGEELVKGAHVTLLGADGETVVSLDGMRCETTTGDDGAYEFHALEEGDYKVFIEPPDGANWSAYTISPKQSDLFSDDEDSDADGIENGDGGLDSAEISGISQPALDKMSGKTHIIAHMDAGIVPRTGKISLHKESTSPDITNGNAQYSLADAVYTIYSDAECKKEAGELATDGNGDAISGDLVTGTYYVKETKAPNGYENDEKAYPVEVQPNETVAVNGGKVLETPETVPTTFVLSKTDALTQMLDGGCRKLAGARFEISFYQCTDTSLQETSTPTRVWIFETDASGELRIDEEHLVSGDALFKLDGAVCLPIGSIAIREIAPPGGYVASDDVIRMSIEGGKPVSNISVANESKKTSLSIEKIWDDDGDRDGLRKNAVVKVTGTSAVTGTVVHSETCVIEAPDGGASSTANATLSDLPAYADGLPIAWGVAEDDTDGYEKTIGEITGSADTGWSVSITNTHRIATAEYGAEKLWDDDGDRDGIRPDSVVLSLVGSDGSNRDATVSAENGWSASFGLVPVHHDGGVPIEYDVVEKTVPNGYSAQNAVVSSEGDGVFRFSLENVHETEKRTITAVKTWDDDDDRDGLRPASLTFELVGSDGSTRTATANAASDWAAVFSDLPVYHNHGTRIDYRIHEKNVPDGYTASGTANGGVPDERGNVVVINEHEPERIDIPVKKIWDDDSDRDGLRSDKIKVSLNGTDGSIREAFLDESGGWEYTFAGLPVYFNHGKKIVYTLVEEPIDGYTHGIVKGADGYSFTITNTHEIAKTAVAVSKTWNDDDDRDGIRPDSIHVVLHGSDGSVREADFGADAGWSGVFEDLPALHDGGNVIAYTVEETPIDGYSAEMSKNEAHGYSWSITNTYSPLLRDIAVEKSWNDDGDRDGIRPDSVSVALVGSDGSEREAILDAESGWECCFTDLPVYHENGTAIDYSVVEEEVDGYEASIVSVDGDGEDRQGAKFIVVNEHVPATIDIAIDKEWLDDGDGAKRPDAIAVSIEGDNGSRYGTVLTADEGWLSVVEGAFRYRDGGIEIDYSVSEDDVPDEYECVRAGDINGGNSVAGEAASSSENGGGNGSESEGSGNGSQAKRISFEIANRKVAEQVQELPADVFVPPASVDALDSSGLASDLVLSKTGSDAIALATVSVLLMSAAAASAVAVARRRREAEKRR